jgi:hypothetical protein
MTATGTASSRPPRHAPDPARSEGAPVTYSCGISGIDEVWLLLVTCLARLISNCGPTRGFAVLVSHPLKQDVKIEGTQSHGKHGDQTRDSIRPAQVTQFGKRNLPHIESQHSEPLLRKSSELHKDFVSPARYEVERQALSVASVHAIFRCAIQETNASYQLFVENVHDPFIGVLPISRNYCVHPRSRTKD